MITRAASLPNDIDALKALVLAQVESAQVAAREHQANVAALEQRLSSRDQEIAHLKLLIDKLRRMQFGRKSERFDREIEQLELRLEDLQADAGAVATPEPVVTTKPEREPVGRKPLPNHLEREDRVHL